MRKKSPIIFLSLFALIFLTACAGAAPETTAVDPTSISTEYTKAEEPLISEPETAPQTTEETEPETSAQNVEMLKSPPELALSDALSSTLNQFVIRSGNYEWTYKEGRKPVSMVACGSHPLDVDPEIAEKLNIPNYNGQNSVVYSISGTVLPARITVCEWDISQLGSPESQPENTVTYESTLLINLKPNKVYELTAEWPQDNFQTTGFYGQARYALITE